MLSWILLAVGLAVGLGLGFAAARWRLSRKSPPVSSPDYTDTLTEGFEVVANKVAASAERICGALREAAIYRREADQGALLELQAQVKKHAELLTRLDAGLQTAQEPSDPEPPAATETAPVIVMSPSPSKEEKLSIEETIAANFRRIDGETHRDFGKFRARFLKLLGDRVHDVQNYGDMALFLERKDRALGWPWPNKVLGRPARDFFEFPQGIHLPVKDVVSPAVLSRRGAEWEVVRRGEVAQ